jgi:4-hydroxybenzoate polyprenyltransferase
VPSVLFAVCWAYGVTGLFALTDRAAALGGPGTALAAPTIALDMLLMRIVDDIRDLPYDRAHNPDRPLVRGAVTVPALLRCYAAVAVQLASE